MDALRIIAVTDGIPALVNQFDLEISFEENIRRNFVDGSLYLRYASDELRREFRAPETYNTLLYGMATGHNRISQLAEFSGFPKNKCDKYLKALDAAGFLETEQKKDKSGNLRTRYYPRGGYFRTWYQSYFPRQDKFFEPLDDEMALELLLEIDEYIMPYYFRKCCWQWMRAFSDVLSWEWKLGREDPMRYDVTINGIDFDFVQHDEDALQKFSEQHECDCVLKIYLPKGLPGAYASLDFPLSVLREYEMLLPPNIQFEIVKVYTFSRPLLIECRAILPSGY